MAINRVNGQMLESNLTRNGVDLSFESTLLYLDVTNQRVGINQATPTVQFEVVGNELHTGASTISGILDVDDLRLDSNILSAQTGDLVLTSVTGNISANNKRILNCADPVGVLDVVNKQTLDTAISSVVLAPYNQIIADNSNLQVIDDGISAGYFDFNLDAIQVATMTGSLFNLGIDTTVNGVLTASSGNLAGLNFNTDTISSDTANLNINATNIGINGAVTLTGSSTNRVIFSNNSGVLDTRPLFTFVASTNTLTVGGAVVAADLTLSGTTITTASSIELTTVSNNDLTITTNAGVIDVVSTAALQLPSGTVAQRPTGVAGMQRWNADNGKVEYYDGSTWQEVQRRFAITSQQFTPGPVTAGSFVIGFTYQIITTGTTDFTLIGAANSTPGTIFTATGVGTGTGTASPYDFALNKSATTDSALVSINGTIQDPEGGSVYSVSGTTLTFTALLTGSDIVSVRFLSD